MDLREPASAVMSPGHIALLRVLAGADETFTTSAIAGTAATHSSYRGDNSLATRAISRKTFSEI
jgi:hypothetical protein